MPRRAVRATKTATPAAPTSANAEDHVSMGANEARHVLAMTSDLAKVLGLELATAAQALDFRRDMLNAAKALAERVGVEEFEELALAGHEAT